MQKLPRFFSLFLFLVSMPVLAESAPRKELIDALKTNNARYFQNVSFDRLQAANQSDAKGNLLLDRVKYKFTPALIGGFRNKDTNVRKAIYRALRFPYYSKKYSRSPKDVLSIKEKWQQYLYAIIDAIHSYQEPDPDALQEFKSLESTYAFSLKEALQNKNYKALAAFSEKNFRTQNQNGKIHLVQSMGKVVIVPLIKAMGEKYCPKETKQLILQELAFAQVGGPEKLIQDIKAADGSTKSGAENRLRKAERLFLLADKEKDESIKKMIVSLATLYYPYK
ncbi:MAG: hypothetical protein AAF518_01220 [Spirochaetota bacterium]